MLGRTREDIDERSQHRRSSPTCARASTSTTANGDGWIIVGEFSALLSRLDQDLSEDECLLAFEMTDADGDGKISFEEFMGWWTGE